MKSVSLEKLNEIPQLPISHFLSLNFILEREILRAFVVIRETFFESQIRFSNPSQEFWIFRKGKAYDTSNFQTQMQQTDTFFISNFNGTTTRICI